jgi:hypothetical protein
VSATNDLLDGVAAAIAAAGIATYSTSGVYTTSQTGIYFSLMPAGSEGTPPGTDRAVVLTAYSVGDNAGRPWTQMRLQIRTRGTADPRDVNTLSDQIYNLLQSLGPVTYGTVTVSQILRVSSLPMGQDSNRRWEQSQNFTCDVNLPATSNRPA